jgi:acetoin utilization protein AcuB
MAFIWVDSAAKVKSPYEARSFRKRVEGVERVKPPEGYSQESDTFTVSDEYQEAHGHSTYKKASEKKKETSGLIYAEHIMSSPVKTLQNRASLADALDFIKSNRFRHVPILNEEKALIGIISDRDVFRYFHEINSRDDKSRNVDITDLVKSRVLTASPDTRISEIARIMFTERIGAMPILDSAHNLTGIITRSDILRALVKSASFESWA